MNISLAVLFKLRMAALLKEVGRRKTAFFHLHSLKGAVWPRGKPIPSMPSAHWYLQATSVETLGRYSTGFISSPLEKRRPRPPRLQLLNETQGQPFSKKYKSNSCTTFQSQCLVESWYPRSKRSCCHLSHARRSLKLPIWHEPHPRSIQLEQRIGGNGWIMEQCMPGEPLDKTFQTLSPSQ